VGPIIELVGLLYKGHCPLSLDRFKTIFFGHCPLSCFIIFYLNLVGPN
jgi:hypothetical protein